jgi:hypothetical protein
MKVTICRNSRTFEAYVSSIGFGMAEVSFYEVVRPSWRIFRTKFLPFHSASFYVSDYDSIAEAIECKLDNGFRIERAEKATEAKWQEFINNSQNS